MTDPCQAHDWRPRVVAILAGPLAASAARRQRPGLRRRRRGLTLAAVSPVAGLPDGFPFGSWTTTLTEARPAGRRHHGTPASSPRTPASSP